MTSEVAHHDLVPSVPAADAPLTNGNGDHDMVDVTDNAGAFQENTALSKSTSTLNLGANAPIETALTDPTPIDNVTAGIASVCDFIPKEAPTSHPTPPPDEPLRTAESNIDTVMTSVEEPAPVEEPATVAPIPSAHADEPPLESNQPVQDLVTRAEPEQVAQSSSIPPADNSIDPEAQPAQISAPVPASSDSGLVRQRDEEDDAEEEERAAKRTRMDEAAQGEDKVSTLDTSQQTVTNGTHGEDVVSPPVAEPQVKEDTAESKPAESALMDVSPIPTSNGEPGSLVKPDIVAAADTSMAADVKPADTPAAPQSLASASTPKYSTTPMTVAQTRFLQDKMKNLKKTKNSLPFLHPVDPVALGIPTYPDLITQPMDLGTMEQNLKSGQYRCVQDFATDFNLIIHNTRTFNGPDHAVTQAGMAMEAYFRKMMETVPSGDQPASQKTQPKKPSPKPPAPARRESRSAAHVPPAQAAPAANATPSETFALQADGTPQIRRESTTNRPARTIKAPPPRELAYAKPKRKEHQMELKFAEEVLTKIRGPKYSTLNSVFLAPVDPVALNIPHYRQIVKHPMDLGTMTQKLKNGQYSRASEVKKDFDLMISNCLAFNPNGNPVRDMGIQLQREFDALWREKEKWEKKHRQARAASASADEESGEDEEDEEEDESSQDPTSTIRALQKQLADMQNALAGLGQAPKQKKAKTTKPAAKKASTIAVSKNKAAPAKSKAKKPKLVTYEEKQEISEAVSKMNTTQVERLTNIITTNCSKYAEQEEMELEIDDLPNNVQAMLLTFVREQFGGPNKKARAVTPDDGGGADDDDFEPSERRGAKGGKRKKHKPMGKVEQQAAINHLQKQLAQFQGGASGSESPTNSGFAMGGQGAETSGDESEESEEE
ncbi:hypothetical protein BST61_g8882 [Cercospora zeina]